MEALYHSAILTLEYLFLLRYNLILLGAMLILIWGSRPGRFLDPMFGGMFELSPKRAGAVAAAGSMVACFLILTSNMVLRYAPRRFEIAPIPGWAIYVFAAIAIAGVVALSLRLIREAIYPAKTVLPVWTGVLLGPVLGVLGVALRDSIPIHALLTRAFALSPEGFLSEGGQPILEHVVLFYVAVFYVLAYLAVGYWTGCRIRSGGTLPIPALGWVLAILLLGVLVLNALSFYFDKFHIALLPAVAILTLVWFRTLGGRIVEHHTYRAYRIPPDRLNLTRPTPSDLLLRSGGKAIVVCASGGGIHAAAWAAALLGEISKRAPEFSKHLVLTSSVSGGSVGCLYYIAGLRAKTAPTAERLFEVASASSLDYVSWGFGFRDLLRFVLPVGRIFHWGNRAWALEKAWRRYADFPVEARLSELSQDVASGKIPASVFNSTLVETGDRFAISTVDLVKRSKDHELRREFSHLYPGLEIPGTTAAALSAAFPVVSPSSHIWVHPDENASPSPEKRYHLTDGGFYDNYGIVSAIEFLNRGRHELAAIEEAMPEVLMLRIQGAEEEPSPAGKDSILFQLSAPLKALLAMRSTSQAVRNDVELGLLRAVLGESDQAGHPCLTCLDFTYPYPNAPLTWHLTAAQKQEILTALTQETIEENLKRVEDFLRPTQPRSCDTMHSTA